MLNDGGVLPAVMFFSIAGFVRMSFFIIFVAH